MATGSISTLGIGSGLELQDILDQLREVDKGATVTPLESKVTAFEAQLEEFTVVKNKLLDMKSKALTLSLSSTYIKRTITSSDEEIVTATVSDGATVQSLSIDVTRLATRSSWSSSTGLTAAASSINVPISRYSTTGLTATSDTFLAANKTMTITYGTDSADTLTISGGAGGKSLQDVVSEINASALAGDLTATAKRVDGKYYLLVASDTATKGEANRVNITSTATGTTFSASPPAALSQFSTSGVANKDTDTFLAANSSFVVNYGAGATYTVSGGVSGKSLQTVVTEINNLSGANAAVKQIGDLYYLHVSSEEVALNEAYKVTISNNTSDVTFQQGDPDDTFSYKVDGSVALVYVAKDTSLTGLASLINADTDNLGVTASAVDTGISATPYKLILEAKETGEDNRIVISDLTQLDMTLEEKQGALAASLNAAFSINGITYQRQTDTVDDLFAGVELTLDKVGSATVSISADNTSVIELITDLVTSYNDAVQEVRAKTAYDEETKAFGILAGTTLRDLPYTLQTLMSTPNSADSHIRSLFDLGLEFDQEGTITIDSEVLTAAIDDYPEGVQAFFVGDEDAEITGLADLVNDNLRDLTGGTGVIDAEKSTAQARIDDLELQIESATERLDKKYEILTKQFVELDRYMNQMNSISSFLTSQFDSLSKQLSGGE